MLDSWRGLFIYFYFDITKINLQSLKRSMSISNPYSASFKLQQQQQQQKPAAQAYRPKSVKRSSINLTLLADGLNSKREGGQVRKGVSRQDDFKVANLGTRASSIYGSEGSRQSLCAYSPDYQVMEAAKIKGNYPTSLPFIVPQADGDRTLSLVAKESIYSGVFKAKLNIPRPTDEVFDMPIVSRSGERVLLLDHLTVFQFPAHLPVAKTTRTQNATRTRSQSAPGPISAIITTGSHGDGRSLASYLQKDGAVIPPSGSTDTMSSQQSDVPVVQNKSPITTFGEGKIGRLLRYRSGKVVLVLNGGITMNLTQGNKADFAELLYSLDAQKQTAHALGPILARGTFAVDCLE